jgi:CRISPR-associated protein Csd1
MILQALAEYYRRKQQSGESDIAPPGFEWKDLPFLIMLSSDGVPVAIVDTREGDGKHRRAKRYLVPQAVKKTVGIRANLLWENTEYALGFASGEAPASNLEHLAKVAERHKAFVERVEALGCAEDAGIRAILSFLALAERNQLLQALPGFEELRTEGGYISFALAGTSGLILERERVHEAIVGLAHDEEEAAEKGVCLVTGSTGPIARLHASIKGVRGAQSSGANIVSYNAPAFCSYGKEKGANAPVGKSVSFAYVTALNDLLSRDSRQRIQIGDTTAVFWASRQNQLEGSFLDIFDEPPKDDPGRGSRAVKAVYEAAAIGVRPTEDSVSQFYVLGLAPNASRLSVRFWIADSVHALASRVREHFQDLEIVRRDNEPQVLSLFRLLIGTAAQGDADNIPPNVAGDLMRAILAGTPYPRTLLGAVVRRMRAEQSSPITVTYSRAALLKACLNRDSRFYGKHEKEMQMSLDDTNQNAGYCLGRLFAVLEKIQTEANPGVNATIRDRFYGAASGTPVTVFGSLIRMKNHHISKIDSMGRRIFFERLIGDILAKIDKFPGHLSMADQGRFAVGYYHQNHELFRKKQATESDNQKVEA